MKKRVRAYMRNGRNRRFWRRLLSVLSCVVAFVTTYALLLPAVTLEKTAACGMEAHQHDQSCFEQHLICGLEETDGHQHTDDCYTVNRVLTCTIEEHSHTEECFNEEGELTCALAEHSHDDGCWREDRVLSCKKEETEPHHHTDACYESVLVCEKPVHIHSPECYVERSLNLAQYLTGDTTIYVRAGNTEGGADGEANRGNADGGITDGAYAADGGTYGNSGNGWLRVDGTAEITAIDLVRLHYAYTIPAGTLTEGNQTLRYALPDNVRLTDDQIREVNAMNGGRGAQAVEGTRTPDQQQAGDEYVSAWILFENVYEKSDQKRKDPIGQNLVLTFDAATIEKNRKVFGKDGALVDPGQEVSGFFSIDVNTDQISFDMASVNDREKETQVTLVEEDRDLGIAPIRRTIRVIEVEEEQAEAVPEILNEEARVEEEFTAVEEDAVVEESAENAVSEEDTAVEENAVSEQDAVGEENTVAEENAASGEDSIEEEASAEEAVNGEEVPDEELGQDGQAQEKQGQDGQNRNDQPEGENSAEDKTKEDVSTEENSEGKTDSADADPEKENEEETKEKGRTTVYQGVADTLTYKGADYTVTASYTEEAGIPEGASLVVSEITEDDDSKAYENYRGQAEEALAQEPGRKVSWIRLFDITIEINGKPIEPQAPVSVQITYHEAIEQAADTTVDTVHFEGKKETPKVLETAAEGTDTATEQVSFETDGFSVFVIVGTVIEKNVLASDGKNYKVTVTYGAETGIPEGAELEVEEILPDEIGDSEEGQDDLVDPNTISVYGGSYDEYVSKTENALGMEEGSAGYIRLFDIKIVDKDDHEIKYQPAEGTVVDVRIELADAEEGKDLSVVHFADGAEEGDKVESSTESVDGRQTVSFEASGFSVYGIVDLDSAETAASVDGLDGNSYYLSMDDGNNRYYYTDPLVLVSNAWKFQRTTTLDSANRFYFEKTEPDEQGNCLYIYIYDAEGNKKYVNLKIETNNLRYYEFGDDEESATKYTVEIHTEGSPTSFVIYHKRANKEFYYWNRNGSYFELAKGTSTSVPKNNGTKIILTKIGEGEDPYGLDGQSLGIIWNVNDTSGSGMISSTGTMSSEITLSDGSGKVKETVNILKNKSTTVRIDPVSRTDRVFVAQNSDITMWTFACCGPAQYYITAVVNGELKYVRFDDTVNVGTGNKGISLVDTPDERCKITVTEGTGTYSGKYKFSSNGRTLYNNNGNFYTVADSQNGSNVWMYFAEQSNLNDDDFVVYTAKKVSVSGPVNEDGTIDYDVKDGDQVVLYTRIWNETTLEYEYYTIDYDGMLVRAYMSGDNISWVGSKVNTMLWDFTEYHELDADGNETDIPNYYYELQNNYSGKYIAPQVTGNEFLADSPIGINLNGRRYNEYYSTVLAWDDPYYDYAMLMVPENEYQLGSAPIALANDTTITRDFYFAIMTNEEESGELSTVETIDHTSFGISVKMINYPGGMQSTANGNYHNMIQTDVLGQTNKSGSVVYANLLKKNLSDNGYPDVALSGYTSHNLSELYSDCSAASETTVNHTFLASTYSETGYFEYDCTQNFAHLITSVDDVWYGMPMPGGGTYGIGDFVVYDQLGTTSETGDTRRHGQYFPYNDLAKKVEVDEDGNLVITPAYSYSTTMYNTTNIKGQAITSLDPRYGEQLYQIPNSNTNKLAPNVDHYFGMEMDASFMQSESGLDAWGHDLIFEFSGDDDFWLYIDGKLVLDLGGIHSACDGSVNFRTGEVNVNGTKTTLRALYKAAYLEEHPDATENEIITYLDGFFKDGGTVFKDYSGHTMKMFYMERGAGASNLHMRFNLAPYVNGEVQLEKEVSGTDTVSTQFPFQIWYEDKISGQFVQVGSAGHDLSVLDANTGDPISHGETYTIDGATYNHVYFLSPGQTASIQLPSEDTEYYFVECGINPNTYDQVTANGETIEGITVADSDTLKDYKIEEDTVSGRKKVIYNNHVSDSAQKTLTVTKRLWRDYDKATEIHSGDGADADNTNFRFRIYIGSGTDKMVDGVGYAVYNTGQYYVKNSDGEYCIWKDGRFVSTGKKVFSDLSTQRAEGEWKSEAEQATFYTSPGGAVDNIKAGYSIEIPGLMAGTLYYIEERSTEIPAGYNLIDYTTTEGAYASENLGEAGNGGTIAADDTNRTVSVHNQHGYGLIVDKVWSDAAFMESHDDIYFGVYLDGTLISESVRVLHHPATSINWFFRELEEGKTLNDYQVYELELTRNGQSITADDITIDPDTGKVTWDPSSNISVTKKEANDSINIGGVSNEYGYSVSYSYTVGYERQELSEQEIADKVNSRTDTVSNSRPGIKFVKTDLGGEALGGAKFVLTDDSGTIRKTFTSAEDGLIVVSYLENDKTYTLTETAAPYGYQTLISSITIKKTVDENGRTIVYVNEVATEGAAKDETGTYELYSVTQVDEPTADNMPTISIRNKDYTLKAVKVDAYSKEPMKDVEFALYKEVYETAGGAPDPNYPMPDYIPMSGYESLITDDDGVIPGIFMKNSETPGGLTPGNYYLREETPSGYNSLGFDIRITISDTGDVTLQSATRPAQSGHWTFDTMPESVANVAYSDGIMLITVMNTPKDPVRIKKLEMGTESKTLQGVSFELYKIGQIDDDGLPREGENAVISGATDKNGLLLLGGLEENTSYYLYETETLPGYNMLTAPVIITTAGPNTINASLNGAPLVCQKVKDSNNNDVWEITVYNSTGYELPSTGGPGTNLIYLIGIMLTGIAGVGLVMRKRRRT